MIEVVGATALAVPERVPGYGTAPDQMIWHKPVGNVMEEFQAIACSDEGIVMPWVKRDIPLGLNKPNERWCADCFIIIQADQAAKE